MTSRTTGTSKRANPRKRSAGSAGVSSPQLPSPSFPALPVTLPVPTNLSSSSDLQRIVKPISGSTTPTIPGRSVLSATAARNVPAFLNKLYNMVNDASTDELIHWGPDGTTFIVKRHEDFAKDVLPRFFKHNNFASFVRQLNMYGFHKIPHLQQGVLHNDGEPEIWEFCNPNFQRNQPDLLCLVTRKKGREGVEEKDAAALDMNYIIQEIAAIKRHQLTISSDLKNIQRENQVLWSESVSIRDRYQRQQETIDKILRFLASVFSTKRQPLMNKKRRLLLGDKPGGLPPESDTGDDEQDDDLDLDGADDRLFLRNGNRPSLSPDLAEAIGMLSPGQMPSTNNHALVPHLSQMQARQQNELNAAEQAANNVSDDIELLQDHLHNISSLVGLDPSVDDLETYDVSDFLGQGHPVDGTEEDRQTLLALMRHHNPNSGADGTTADYFSNFGVLPASIPPTSSTPTDGTSMNIGSSMADMSQYAPSLTVPTMEVNAPGTGASSFRTGANSGLHVTDLATVVPSTTLPSGLPAVGTDDMQDPMFNLDDPFHNLALPENLDASDFDFLQDES